MNKNSKVVILAGGLGSRLSEETLLKPKPMVEIGGLPILWHIMKIYGHYGFRDFIICLGYKGHIIKEYFVNYFMHSSEVTVHLAENRVEINGTKVEPWKITMVDTGESTQTGGRLKRILPFVREDPFFAMTYGDGVANIDLGAQVAFHLQHGRLASVTAVRPPARFGALRLDGDRIVEFTEKAESSEGWINGGFFLLSPKIGDLISGDDTVWEREPLEELVRTDDIRAFQHTGFWHPMDTIRDRNVLEKRWASANAPWKLW